MSIGIRLLRTFGQLLVAVAAAGITFVIGSGAQSNAPAPSGAEWVVFVGAVIFLPVAFLLLSWLQLAGRRDIRKVTGHISASIGVLTAVFALVAMIGGLAGVTSGYLMAVVGNLLAGGVGLLYALKAGESTETAPATDHAAGTADAAAKAGRAVVIVSAVSLAAILASLFLPWYGSSGEASSSLGGSISGSLNATGFEMIPWGFLAMIAGAVGLIMALLKPLRKLVFVPFAVALLSTLPVLFTSSSMSVGVDFGGISSSASSSAGPQVGVFIALGAAVIAVIVTLVLGRKAAAQRPAEVRESPAQ